MGERLGCWCWLLPRVRSCVFRSLARAAQTGM